MNNFWVGFSVGAGAIIVVMFLVAVLGCESALDVMIEPGVVNNEYPIYEVPTSGGYEPIEPPERPPLPEGWRAEGDLWINDITKDTM